MPCFQEKVVQSTLDYGIAVLHVERVRLLQREAAAARAEEICYGLVHRTPAMAESMKALGEAIWTQL
jgi:hypothetical protein